MKRTQLYQKHVDAGAKMVPFAGFEMPVQYEGVKKEHTQVRERAGIFDVSHMGEFFIEGDHALDLLQKISANDAAKLVNGKAQYSYMPNDKGGVIDDFIIYRINEKKYMVVVNAANIQKDWDWIDAHNEWEAQLTDVSDEYNLLAVQGPNATEVLQTLTDVPLSDMKLFSFAIDTLAGAPDVIISATGYTGAGGFELYVKKESAEQVWDAVIKAGQKYDLCPIGLAARDTLRLEAGFCLYGNDIDDSTSPIAAGLGWATKFNKDFINKDEIATQKEEGTAQKLTGFEMIGKGIPRKDYNLLDDQDSVIGRVTSGTMSPSLGKSIGMGYIRKDLAQPGSKVYVEIRNKKVEALVKNPPFYKN